MHEPYAPDFCIAYKYWWPYTLNFSKMAWYQLICNHPVSIYWALTEGQSLPRYWEKNARQISCRPEGLRSSWGVAGQQESTEPLSWPNTGCVCRLLPLRTHFLMRESQVSRMWLLQKRVLRERSSVVSPSSGPKGRLLGIGYGYLGWIFPGPKREG